MTCDEPETGRSRHTLEDLEILKVCIFGIDVELHSGHGYIHWIRESPHQSPSSHCCLPDRQAAILQPRITTHRISNQRFDIVQHCMVPLRRHVSQFLFASSLSGLRGLSISHTQFHTARSWLCSDGAGCSAMPTILVCNTTFSVYLCPFS